MNRSLTDSPLLVAVVTLSAATFLVLLWLLSTLSTPAQADQRLGIVEARLRHAEAALKATADLDRYPTGAICRDADTGLAAGRGLIEAAGSRTGVRLVEDRVSPAGPAPGPMLAALAVDVTAKGQEAAVTGFLRNLASGSPTIVADGLDLTSDGVEVTLHLKGRFLCHDRRLP